VSPLQRRSPLRGSLHLLRAHYSGVRRFVGRDSVTIVFQIYMHVFIFSTILYIVVQSPMLISSCLVDPAERFCIGIPPFVVKFTYESQSPTMQITVRSMKIRVPMRRIDIRCLLHQQGMIHAIYATMSNKMNQMTIKPNVTSLNNTILI
jgi:hypothetical protein